MKQFKENAGRYVSMISALVLAIAAFLPWGNALGFAVSGWNGDGKITFGLALLALLALSIKRLPLWISFALAFMASSIGAIDLYNMGLQNTPANEFGITISAGIGLYLTLVAGLVAILGIIYQRKLENKNPSTVAMILGVTGSVLVLISIVYTTGKVPTLPIALVGAAALIVAGIMEAYKRKKKMIGN